MSAGMAVSPTSGGRASATCVESTDTSPSYTHLAPPPLALLAHPAVPKRVPARYCSQIYRWRQNGTVWKDEHYNSTACHVNNVLTACHVVCFCRMHV